MSICLFLYLSIHLYVFVDFGPVINAGKHATCINQRPGISLTCVVEYSGSNLMPLVMNWATSSGMVLNSRTSNFSSIFMSSICLLQSSSAAAAAEVASSYTCSITFSHPSDNAVFQGDHAEYYQQKSNAPSFTVSTSFETETDNDKRDITERKRTDYGSLAYQGKRAIHLSQ